ncbi:MAG: beta-ketoacyl-[acyl-carrier-protein] synthase family protein [Dissulfuribacterales bacterium]
MKNRVVITGMGVVSPNAIGLDNFKNALKEGESGIKFLPELEELNFGCRIGGVPDNCENILQEYFNLKNYPYLSDSLGYAITAAIEAWNNAGMKFPTENGPTDWDTGAIIGSAVSGLKTFADHVVPKIIEKKVRRIKTRVAEQVMGSASSARISGLFGIGNQSTSNSSACSTGTEAIIEAVWKIRTGLAKKMLAGSTEGASPYIWGPFDSMRVLASRFNDQPRKGSRPMSASARGFVPGGGAGILFLESLKSAQERNADIYAEIIGVHANCGGHRNGGSMTAPNPEGVYRCIQGAVRDANIKPEDIDAINGHLTATYVDPIEIRTWSAALNLGPKNFPYINSTKSMIGHCLGAAGSIETVASVLELKDGFLHPSINCEDLHPEIQPFADRIPQVCMDYPELRTIVKASFGFGDVNSCIIIKKWGKN